jgi:sugar diacid utilization regulator
MARPLRSAGLKSDTAQIEAVRVVAARLAAQREQVARRVVEISRREIVDYQTPPDPRLLDQLYTASLEHVDALVASLQSGEPVAVEHLARVRELGARRLHQGVPLESLGRAARLWATVCWQMVLSVARIESPGEREAALEVAARVFDLGDRISLVATQGYQDEITDRGLLRRELLDALLTGNAQSAETVRLARRLHVRLEDRYVVVVVRGEGVDLQQAREQSAALHTQVDRMVEETRRAVRPPTGAALAGIRNDDLVVLYPASSAADLDAVRRACGLLGAALGPGVSIGMSGWHGGRQSVGSSYVEALDAAAIAVRSGTTGRAVTLEEVLVDHMLAASEPARQILEDAVRPLLDYDASRAATLVPTLRAYLGAGLNLTKASESLFVNPNTVVYRLRRIKELSGRDVHDIDDLVVLYLALKLEELR